MIKIDINTIKHKGDIKVDGSLRIESVSELLPYEMAVVLYKLYNSNKEAFFGDTRHFVRLDIGG